MIFYSLYIILTKLGHTPAPHTACNIPLQNYCATIQLTASVSCICTSEAQLWHSTRNKMSNSMLPFIFFKAWSHIKRTWSILNSCDATNVSMQTAFTTNAVSLVCGHLMRILVPNASCPIYTTLVPTAFYDHRFAKHSHLILSFT